MQKETVTKKINKESRKNVRKSGKKIVKSATRTKDNNPPGSNIYANMKLSSDDGMTPSNCLTLSDILKKLT